MHTEKLTNTHISLPRENINSSPGSFSLTISAQDRRRINLLQQKIPELKAYALLAVQKYDFLEAQSFKWQNASGRLIETSIYPLIWKNKVESYWLDVLTQCDNLKNHVFPELSLYCHLPALKFWQVENYLVVRAKKPAGITLQQNLMHNAYKFLPYIPLWSSLTKLHTHTGILEDRFSLNQKTSETKQHCDEKDVFVSEQSKLDHVCPDLIKSMAERFFETMPDCEKMQRLRTLINSCLGIVGKKTLTKRHLNFGAQMLSKATLNPEGFIDLAIPVYPISESNYLALAKVLAVIPENCDFLKNALLNMYFDFKVPYIFFAVYVLLRFFNKLQMIMPKDVQYDSNALGRSCPTNGKSATKASSTLQHKQRSLYHASFFADFYTEFDHCRQMVPIWFSAAQNQNFVYKKSDRSCEKHLRIAD